MVAADFPISFSPFRPSDYVFKIARSAGELEGFWRLRREIFCEEQRIFDRTDRDEYDHTMIPIVCVSLIMGMEDRVVGVVRIDERAPGVWWGSRLGVDHDFRHIGRLSPSVPIRNRQPRFYAGRSIGAGLIYKAVTTANALGCRAFYAFVQEQNAAFFRRLHWKGLGDIEIYGMTHVEMEAELEFYPPAEHDIVRPAAA